MATLLAAPDPLACKLYNCNWDSCWVPAEGYNEVGGADLTCIATPLNACSEIPIGAVSTGLTPAVGAYTCFEFVINAPTTIDARVALPTGITWTSKLYSVLHNWLEAHYHYPFRKTKPARWCD